MTVFYEHVAFDQWHLSVPNGMLLEVPYTLQWWVVAPYGCDIGILLKSRQRVAVFSSAARP